MTGGREGRGAIFENCAYLRKTLLRIIKKSFSRAMETQFSHSSALIALIPSRARATCLVSLCRCSSITFPVIKKFSNNPGKRDELFFRKIVSNRILDRKNRKFARFFAIFLRLNETVREQILGTMKMSCMYDDIDIGLETRVRYRHRETTIVTRDGTSTSHPPGYAKNLHASFIFFNIQL